jgi:transcriptional regulator with XRE-family HTH domain
MLDLSNVNYSEVSRRTLLSLSFVSLIFRGKRRPSTDATLKISQALSEMLGTPVSMEHLHLALAKKRAKEKKIPKEGNEFTSG